MKPIKTLSIILLLGIVATYNVWADYLVPIVQQIPLERLIHNLQKQRAEDPSEPHNYYALGRLYAMAFARKSDTLDAIQRKGEKEVMPYYGYEPVLPHLFAVNRTNDTLKQREAMQFLDSSLYYFHKAIVLDSSYLPSRLGFAWCTEYKGDTAQAIIFYHELLKETAKHDRPNLTSRETCEISGYLLHLLNEQNNADEVKMLKKKIKNFRPVYMVSPVLIPLEDNTGIDELTDISAHVKFDLDGSGIKQEWQWITPRAGWLVYAPKDRPIQNAFQLFGTVSFNIFWDNGFKAMAVMDDNADGQLTGNELNDMAVWKDSNSNGICEPSELISLKTLNITALNFKIYEKAGKHLLVNKKGVVFANGTIRPSYDWFPKNADGKDLKDEAF